MPNDTTNALIATLESLPEDDQRELIEAGEQFGTDSVLMQLERQVEAFEKFGAIPPRFGFTTADQAELATVGPAISDYSGVRVQQGVQRNASTDGYRNAFSAAKNVLASAKDVIVNASGALLTTTAADKQSVRKTLDAGAAKLGKVGRSKTKLVAGLTLARDVLSDEQVKAATHDRGGPEMLSEVIEALASINSRNTPGSKGSGTPLETRKLNLLEGLAVTLLRRARSAARAWARHKKDETVAKAHELSHLYPPARNPQS